MSRSADMIGDGDDRPVVFEAALTGTTGTTGTTGSIGRVVVDHVSHRVSRSVSSPEPYVLTRGQGSPTDPPGEGAEGDRRPWRSPVESVIIDCMNSPGDIDGTVSDDRDPDDGPTVVDEERIVAGADLPDDAEDDVPVPLDVAIEVPTADAIDQHRSVTLDDDHDQV